MARTALVTGASSGIGKMVAQELNRAGFQVYGAARRVERMADLKAEGITPVALDLIEDVPLAEGRRQFDVNLFGMARLIQLVTPSMRAQHYGKIVNISSMGGKIWTKFGGWYHATKYAVEGLSDCLRMELKPFCPSSAATSPCGASSSRS